MTTAVQRVQAPPKKRFWSWKKGLTITAYLFVTPWLLRILAFYVYPLIYAVYISFTRWKVTGDSEWVGLANFQFMPKDPLFKQALRVTTFYTITSVPLALVIGFIVAYLLNQKIKGLNVFRTIYYLPTILSGPAVALVWQWMFDTNFGLINYLLGLVGIPKIPWITSKEWVIPAFIVMSLWTIGTTVLLYLAGLQGVPQELYEAAEVDGAGRVRKLWHVTLPMMSPVIFFNLVTMVVGSFQTFTQAYIITSGGPANASLVYYLYLYQVGFQFARLGYAAALGWVLFIILVIVTVILFRTFGAQVYYEGE